MGPTLVKEEADTAIGKMCIDVFGEGWGSFKIAHISTGDKIGIEMFEFPNNEKPEDFDYWKTGTFHFCVQDPNIEALVEKKSSPMEASSGCRSGSNISEKKPTSWFMSKPPLASCLRYTLTVTN